MAKDKEVNQKDRRAQIFGKGMKILDKREIPKTVKMGISLAMNEQLELAADLRNVISVIQTEIENIEYEVESGKPLSGSDMAESMIRIRRRLNRSFGYAAEAYSVNDKTSRADFTRQLANFFMFGDNK